MLWMPESPRYLIEKNKREKAEKILERMRGSKEIASHEADKIEATVEEEKILLAGRNRYSELLRVPALRHALVIGVSLQIFQQFCGINTVMYYSPTILQLSDSSSSSEETVDSDRDAIYASMIVAAANMIMSFVAVFTIDRIGRKILLLCSLTGVTLALLVLSFAFYSNDYSYLALVGLVAYIIAFAPGMGPVPWTINSEIYPLYVRAGANSVSSCSNWISNLIVSLTFLSLIDWITASGTFILFAVITGKLLLLFNSRKEKELISLFCFAVVAFIFVFLLVPETKGKTLEDIEVLFQSKWIVPNICGKKPEQVVLNQ